MNERIKKLKEQATSYTWNGNDVTEELDEDRFAELIVQECSKVIRHGGQRKGAFGNEDLRPSEIATMIEEHFGVEE